MKKLKGTPYNELKIQRSNIWLDLLSSLPFIVVGLWLVFSAQNTTLSCQQIESKQGNCKLTESSLSGSKTQEISLDNLVGGKVTTGRKRSTRVELLTKSGEIPFTNYDTRWGDKNDIANKINDFVANPDRKSLNVSQDDRWFLWTLGSICVVTGVLEYVWKREKLNL
ncbi:MAG: hypothetical protein EAZ94_17565 [Oscillatoriales cyanobacterium]|nr:MAG: hypothetical protein EAZ94_17565 [Oscillatoriales cyanobacterium]TAE22453.1 MAG: hypothetical protein EAZ93_18140 [Oscillatoriales cyanobacterium]